MSPFLRLTNPLVWGRRGTAARKLAGFAAVEAESVLEMRAAVALTPDASRRALYLQHALDEARHARVFIHAARERGGNALEPRATSEDLFELLGEERFLAFVHRGERRGREQFESYQAYFAARNPAMARLFEGVLVDERRHEAYTGELLLLVAGNAERARAALRWAAVWEARRTWARFGQGVSHAVYTAMMLMLYAALAPLALAVRLGRPSRVGFRPTSRDAT